MEEINSLLSLIILLFTIWGTATGFRRFRGRQFGPLDLLVFVPLAIGSDILTHWLFKAVEGPHADSAAYGALAALIFLSAAAPLALLLNLIAGRALLTCLFEYPGTRLPIVVCTLLAGIGLWIHQNEAKLNEPGELLNSSHQGGETWALETEPRSRADCDRKSSNPGFRSGCYKVVDHFDRRSAR